MNKLWCSLCSSSNEFKIKSSTLETSSVASNHEKVSIMSATDERSSSRRTFGDVILQNGSSVSSTCTDKVFDRFCFYMKDIV